MPTLLKQKSQVIQPSDTNTTLGVIQKGTEHNEAHSKSPIKHKSRDLIVLPETKTIIKYSPMYSVRQTCWSHGNDSHLMVVA